MKPKAVLRQLLRVIDRHVTSVAGNQQWKQHVLSQFRANALMQDSIEQQRLLLVAREYAELVTSIMHHQELLKRYNIGVDPDERNKEMVAKTAARVGFELPQPGAKPPPPPRQQQQQQGGQQEQHVDRQQTGHQQQRILQQQEESPQQQEEQHELEGGHASEQQGVGQMQRGVPPAMAYAQRLQGVRKAAG